MLEDVRSRVAAIDARVSSLNAAYSSLGLPNAPKKMLRAPADAVQAEIALRGCRLAHFAELAEKMESDWVALLARIAEARSAYSQLATSIHELASGVRYVQIDELDEAVHNLQLLPRSSYSMFEYCRVTAEIQDLLSCRVTLIHYLNLTDQLHRAKFGINRLRSQAYKLCENMKENREAYRQQQAQIHILEALLDPSIEGANSRGVFIKDTIADLNRERATLVGGGPGGGSLSDAPLSSCNDTDSDVFSFNTVANERLSSNTTSTSAASYQSRQQPFLLLLPTSSSQQRQIGPYERPAMKPCTSIGEEEEPAAV